MADKKRPSDLTKRSLGMPKPRKGLTQNEAYSTYLYNNQTARSRAGDAARKMAKEKGGKPRDYYRKSGK